ncbi:MAG: Alpha/beta hydrolase family protein [Rhodospirillales bacterium]|nr:Alpha/beta hydrolase family protein [Rhodospirillales bacterium]
MSTIGPAPDSLLPPGVRARIVHGVNGLAMHMLEAGYDDGERPVVLLLHGFPELAYSWRKVMKPLADAGFHVVAPDQRGYGRTGPAPIEYDDDLGPFRLLNLVRDMVALTSVLGLGAVSAVVGHDYGASVAAACALVRPDLFRSLIIMSAPFTGPPSWPLAPPPSEDAISQALASLDPPRKHYHAYFATRAANQDMWHCRQGVHAFLRAYFHFKSADWPGNKPFELQSWSAEELARMPNYYVMPLGLGMADAVAPEMPSERAIAAWLPDSELRFYSDEYVRTGFQGGLQWYRGRMNGSLAQELALFAGRTIDCPALFMAGDKDWGAYQIPGGLQRMRSKVFTDMRDHCLVEGAGHWVQQERPEATCAHMLNFITSALGRSR